MLAMKLTYKVFKDLGVRDLFSESKRSSLVTLPKMKEAKTKDDLLMMLNKIKTEDKKNAVMKVEEWN